MDFAQRAGRLDRLRIPVASEAHERTKSSSKSQFARSQTQQDTCQDFYKKFRGIVGPRRMNKTGACLHLVFGNIAEVRNIPIVIPINQSFDFAQRGPKSVLAAFESIKVRKVPFYDYLAAKWPVEDRPKSAGIGYTKCFQLPTNSSGIPAVMFVVTTRDFSTSKEHYGLYANTPLESINLVLDDVLAEAERLRLNAIALPLLGAGYANIQRPVSEDKLKRAIILLTIQKLESKLSEETTKLSQALIVVYSAKPHSSEEHNLWDPLVTFLARPSAKREEEISKLLNEVGEEEQRHIP